MNIILFLNVLIIDFQKIEDKKNNIFIIKEYKKEVVEKQEFKEIKKETIFDFKTDYSVQKFVSDRVSFNNLSYIPTDLISLKGDYLIDIKGISKIREVMNKDLQNLSFDFYKEFEVKLKIVSAYRSYSYQKGIKDRGCSDLFCAKAGYSEHQTGLAIDIFEATSEKEFLSKDNYKKYFEWMNKNAYKYGFHNSYRFGKEIDGYEIEPWHWRYLGYDLAKILQEKNTTFAKYLNNN